MIEHVGAAVAGGYIQSGHYWAQSKRHNPYNNTLTDDIFYRINDSSVSTGAGTPTNETFMVAYHITD
jgi:hypothetical protein